MIKTLVVLYVAYYEWCNTDYFLNRTFFEHYRICKISSIGLSVHRILEIYENEKLFLRAKRGKKNEKI